MTDLSVTDVQKALRMYAENGHDILSDPRAVTIGSDKTPYRMPSFHELHITKGDIGERHSLFNTLESHFQQTERPLISTVQSFAFAPREPLSKAGIVGVHYSTPKLWDKGESWFDRAVWPPKPAPGIWARHFPDNSESAIHKALQEHTSKDIDVEIPKGWNLQEAHTRLGKNIPAFSNLVSVFYPQHDEKGNYAGHKRYVYDTATEQLHTSV